MDRDRAALAVEVSNGAELGNPGLVRRDREKKDVERARSGGSNDVISRRAENATRSLMSEITT